MPLGSVLYLAIVIAAFTTFGLVLFWAERRTANMNPGLIPAMRVQAFKGQTVLMHAQMPICC